MLRGRATQSCRGLRFLFLPASLVCAEIGCCSLGVCVRGPVTGCVKKAQASVGTVSQCRCVPGRGPAGSRCVTPVPAWPLRSVRPAPRQALFCTSASLTGTLSRQAVERSRVGERSERMDGHRRASACAGSGRAGAQAGACTRKAGTATPSQRGPRGPRPCPSSGSQGLDDVAHCGCGPQTLGGGRTLGPNRI